MLSIDLHFLISKLFKKKTYAKKFDHPCIQVTLIFYMFGSVAKMRIEKRLILLSLLILTSIFSLAHSDGMYTQIEGQEIDVEKFDALIEGEAEKQQIIEALGTPVRSRIDGDGIETLEYISIQEKDSYLKVLLVVALVTYTKTYEEQAIVEIRDGKMRRKIYNDKIRRSCSSLLFFLDSWFREDYEGLDQK